MDRDPEQPRPRGHGARQAGRALRCRRPLEQGVHRRGRDELRRRVCPPDGDEPVVAREPDLEREVRLLGAGLLGRGGGRRARAGLAEGDCLLRPATCQREAEHAQREHPGECEPRLHCYFPSTRVDEFPALMFAQEGVSRAVRVARDEVRGEGGEGEHLVVAAERDPAHRSSSRRRAGPRTRGWRSSWCRPAGRGRRRPGCRWSWSSLGNEVRGQRVEGDVAAVGAEARCADVLAVRLPAGAADADARRPAGLAVVDEDVERPVGVAGHQVRVGRVEGDIAAVAADRRRVAAVVRAVGARLLALAGDADALRAAGAAVADEHVGELVRVSPDEVRRRGLERDIAAVGAERRLSALAPDLAPGLDAAARDAHPRGLAGGEVADEDVHLAIRVAGDEVRGGGLEGHVAAARADRGRAAGAVRLAVRADADPLGHAARAVVQEDVGDAVGVAGDEVRRVRLEDDVAPVRADAAGDRAAPGIARRLALGAASRDADPLGLAVRAVVHEDVPALVRVAGDEVGRLGVDQDEPAVRAEADGVGVAVRLHTGARDADAHRGCGGPGRSGGREQQRERGEDDEQAGHCGSFWRFH